MPEQTTDAQRCDRKQQHATMLREALARPGVREVMEVYRDYQNADKGLDSYRLAARPTEKVSTTDHANVM